MAEETVLLPGSRRVEGTLESPGESGGAPAVVVEAPPHPQLGGSRSNRLLRAVADSLVERGLAAMRFDYGEWDDGRGERADVENAIRWGAKRYDRVGAFGYSFGGAMVALAAGSVDRPLCGVSLLAPAAQVADFDPFETLAAIEAPLQVVYGSRDETASWESIVEAARERGASVAQVEGDHFFVGQQAAIGESVADHLAGGC